jgi:predicted ATPase/DNA-binding CsgD family transcriptional regulator
MSLKELPDFALTRREREVAALVADGLTNREIAQRLFISERTADGHLEHIREKLGFNSRAQIAAWVVGHPQDRPLPERAAASNLPDRRTSFVGRDLELEELRHTLADARMLTLTGAGGCGKTRLAIEAARHVQGDFPDGTWLAELAPVSEAAQVPSTVAASLGVREDPGRSFLDVVAESLRGKRLLLVLDNCEHVLDAAAQACDQLLDRCPELRILATSRQVLGVEGERNLPVLPLGLPSEEADAEEVVRSEAGELFLDRAHAVWPDIEIDQANAGAVRSICQRLDGMPLAIELAAARVGFLTPQEIDQRLDDRFSLLTSGARLALPRHRTLRALIDWSYDLLSEDEAILYRRLGVFVGGFTLEAAERVCSSEPLMPDGILDSLGQVVQKSLVAAEQLEGRNRYRMLETIREHALERLKASGEEDGVRSRHLDWFVSFLERSETELAGPQQLDTTRRIAREFGNVRGAFTWSLADGDIESALRLVANRRFWQALQGYGAEVRGWIDAVLARADGADPSLRAPVLAEAGEFQRLNGELDSARKYLEEALSVQRGLRDSAVGRTLYMLGRVELAAGRTERAYEVTEEGVAIARSVGNTQQVGERLSQLGEVEYDRSSPERASPLLGEALRVAREAGDAHSIADSLRVLGMIARDAGQFEEARSCLDEALSLQRGLADSWCEALSLSVLGELVLLAHQPAQASPLFAESLSIQRRIGYQYGMADSLWGLAAAAAGVGLLVRSAQLLGAEESLRREGGVPFRIARAERHDTVILALRQRMEDAALAAAWREGLAMGRVAAVAYALAEPAAGRDGEHVPSN